MKRQSALQRLTPMTAAQWGLVTTAQARQMGIPRTVLSRMEADGRLERMCKGVYRTTASPEEQFDMLRASWLSLYPERTAEERILSHPPDAVVSGRTAAWLLGTGDMVPEPYQFSTPVRKQTQRTDIELRIRRYPEESLTIRGELPVTTFEQTVTDLVAYKEDLSLIEDMFMNCDAETYVNIDRPYLVRLLAPYAGRNGYRKGDGEAFLRDLISVADGIRRRTFRTLFDDRKLIREDRGMFPLR